MSYLILNISLTNMCRKPYQQVYECPLPPKFVDVETLQLLLIRCSKITYFSNENFLTFSTYR